MWLDKDSPMVTTKELGLSSRTDSLKRPSSRHKRWQALSLGTPFLSFIILLSLVLGITIELLLIKSARDSGVVMAEPGSTLSFGHAFPYQTLPTIIAIIYSILWAWIDLDVKRLEPYYQLSKSNGASGRDTVLLHYPFDFFATVPIKSILRRHWTVFVASTAMALISLGLVPFQSAIFANQKVTTSVGIDAHVSTAYIDAAQQPSRISSNYTYSTYATAFLNETLPPFTTRQFILAAVRADLANIKNKTGNLTVETRMYSVDLTCHTSELFNFSNPECGPKCGPMPYWSNPYGCRLPGAYYNILGNDTIGERPQKSFIVRKISKIFAAYSDARGFASFYLQGLCPANSSHIFFSQIAQNKNLASDPPNKPLVQFCEPRYYYQNATTTLMLEGNQVLEAQPHGPKIDLPAGMFNQSLFDSCISGGMQFGNVRGNIPLGRWPDFTTALERLNLTDSNDPSDAMFAYVMGSSPGHQVNITSSEDMAKAWQAAYRILFSRYMSEILHKDFPTFNTTRATLHQKVDAIVVIPAFAYLAQGILYGASLLAFYILYSTKSRNLVLCDDPSSISAILAMTANSPDILGLFKGLGAACDAELEESNVSRQYGLVADNIGRPALRSIDDRPFDRSTHRLCQGHHRHRGVRPSHLRTLSLLTFVLLSFGAMIILAVFFVKARAHGLPLPSNHRFILQLLKNYLPTAIGALMEPMWTVISRYICLLQPFESLRSGGSSYMQSLALNYNSLPPQLSLYKTIRSRHWVLSLVSLMSILANVLAIAMSSLFSERTLSIPQTSTIKPSYHANLLMAPNMTMDDTYSLMTGLTSRTALPAWMDETFFYLPVTLPLLRKNAEAINIRTQAFGATLNCRPFTPTTFDKMTDLEHVNVDKPVAFFYGFNSLARGSVWSIMSKGKLIIPGWKSKVIIPPRGALSEGLGFLDPRTYKSCDRSQYAAEYFAMLNASDSTHGQGILAGWMRSDLAACKRNNSLSSGQQTTIYCEPRFRTGPANVLVDAHGRVLRANTLYETNLTQLDFDSARAPGHKSSNSRESAWLRTNNILDFGRALSLQIIANGLGGRSLMELRLQGIISPIPSDIVLAASEWHNDTFPSDFTNFFMAQLAGNNDHLDPRLSAPSTQKMAALLSRIYSRIFAQALAQHHAELFSTLKVEALEQKTTVYLQERRIVMSTSAFVTTECILSIFIVVLFLLYLSRPARFLPRYPTTIASVTAYTANSSLTTIFQKVHGYTAPERDEALRSLGYRYGFGRYLGTDNNESVGIESDDRLQEKLSASGRLRLSTWLGKST